MGYFCPTGVKQFQNFFFNCKIKSRYSELSRQNLLILIFNNEGQNIFIFWRKGGSKIKLRNYIQYW